MKKTVFLLFLFLISSQIYAQYQVTHQVLEGVWSYFYITNDQFADDIVVSMEQRIYILDSQNAQLSVVTDEKNYQQQIDYKLSYKLSLRDNTMYFTLYTPKSPKVLGAYVRMLSPDTIEMAKDPNFRTDRQLYIRQSPNLSVAQEK